MTKHSAYEQKKKNLLILLILAVAIIIPLVFHFVPAKPRTHYISLDAKKYGYTPARIVVNKGDTIVLKPRSLDVTHGFLLDGYPIELILKKGMAFQKYFWQDESGNQNIDWDRVKQTKFVAHRAGKFTYRCNQTCGNLHPFMTGELIVKPNTLYHLFVSLSIGITLSLLLLFRSDPEPRFAGFKRVNLLERLPWLNRMVAQRGFQFALILPNFIVFYLFIFSSLWGSPVGNRNIAVIFVWILWWFVLKAILVPLGGRIWCTVCPLPAPAEWLSRKSFIAVRYIQKPFKKIHHHFTGLQKDWPKWLDNIWLQNIFFLAMISFGIILITRPVATAFLFLFILTLSLILALLYRHRVFCLYLCPLGGFLGTYSMAAMTEIRVKDPQVCKKHKEKSCYTGGPGGWACPWKQYVGRMNRNNYCGLCTECIRSCPKENIGFFIRPFGSDRLLRGYDEMFNVIIMMVIAIAFSITMLGPWGFIKEAANVTESRQVIPFLIYLAIIWGSALLIFPGLFALTAVGARRLSGGSVKLRDLMFRLAYILIPVGIFAWIAFSLPAIMVNYSYILSVLSDPLGLGWNLFGTADFPYKPFFPEWIPLIQGVILLTGLYLGISRTYLGIKPIIPAPVNRAKTMLLPSLFALVLVNLLLKLYMG